MKEIEIDGIKYSPQKPNSLKIQRYTKRLLIINSIIHYRI